MPSSPEEALRRLERLADDVALEFDAIRERHSTSMECRPGCSDCCRCRLSITHAEAAFLRKHLESLPVAERQELAARARDRTREMCPGLDDEGRCQIHAARPVICRSFGAPLRQRRPVALIQPEIIDVCDKNFVQIDTKTLPPDDVIEQTSLMDRVADLNADYCASKGLMPDERIPIAKILVECV